MNLKKIYTAWKDAALLASMRHEQLRLVRAQILLNPDLEELVLIEGAKALMRQWARDFRPAAEPTPPHVREETLRKAEVRRQEFKRFEREHEVTTEKAKNFDRIVEMLDHKQVGNKILGDCTRADLLRAAVASETAAKEATIDAGFYRLLAGMIGNGTVREASDRGKVVALLTATFKEAA